MLTEEALQLFLPRLPKTAALSEKEVEDFYVLGFSLYQTGSFQEASDVFEVLCSQSPFQYAHWFALASSLQESANYEKALHAWSMAAVLDPSHPKPHFHAAECCFSLGQMEEAKRALEASSKRAEDDLILQDQIEALQTRWSEILCRI